MNSLRNQLLIRLLAGGTLLLGGAGVALHWEVRRALTNEFDRTLAASVQSLAALAERDEDHAALEFTGEDLPQFGQPGGSEVFLLRRVDGKEYQRSASLGKADLPLRAGAAEAPSFFDVLFPDGRSMRCAGVRFVPHEENEEGKEKKNRLIPRPRPEAVLVVGHDRAPLDRTIANLRAGMLVVEAIALAALSGIVWWSVRGALTPLDEVGESVAAVNANSLETRFPVDPLPAELRPIVQRLNELLARLEEAFARERRFTTTAAHELRTPLAELRALAEVNLTVPSSEAEREQSWKDALAVTNRMESLAGTLLQLARTESRSEVIRPESVSIPQAISSAWQPWAARAAERRLAFEINTPDALSCETDATLLGIILGNLCGNAAEHAPVGSTITVTAGLAADPVSISFSNRANDLTEADLPNLFERFWRKDAARTDARHHGLGLALAADFARLLGGKLSATLDKASNLNVSLSLPAVSPSTLSNSQPSISLKQNGSAIPTQLTNLHEI